MSRWTHSICVECWNKQRPENQVDHGELDNTEPEICCWCEGKTTTGIYLRADPAETLCQGIHKEKESDGIELVDRIKPHLEAIATASMALYDLRQERADPDDVGVIELGIAGKVRFMLDLRTDEERSRGGQANN